MEKLFAFLLGLGFGHCFSLLLCVCLLYVDIYCFSDVPFHFSLGLVFRILVPFKIGHFLVSPRMLRLGTRNTLPAP